MQKNSDTYVCDTLFDVSHLMLEHFIKLSQDSVFKRGSFHVAFSGGNTPQLFYSLLASKPYIDMIPWEHIYIYQTDERFVPFSHPDNNFMMLSSILIDKVPSLNKRAFCMQTENIGTHESAARYADLLKNMLPKNEDGFPRFDYVLLGVGTDGHIASLFSDAEHLESCDKLVVDLHVKRLQSWRISLSLSLLNKTQNLIIIASGKHKAHIVEAVLSSNGAMVYQIQKLNPNGKLIWYLDKDTAPSIIHL